MESDDLTQCTQNTQGVMDPRRLGRNNSGLSAEDCSDVMCILHPGTPAAFQLVAETARRAPQHILQDVRTPRIGYDATPSMLEEQETFILDENGANVALDLAFRFSSCTVQPHLGFTFGRNMTLCDIAPSSDTHKRVSNLHFAIYMNESGVLMIKDLSTNGTMVDDILLRGKNNIIPVTRMLNHGSIVQILTEKPEEALKFIIRIPARAGHLDQFEEKYRIWMDRKMDAEVEKDAKGEKDVQLGNLHNHRGPKMNHKQGDATTQVKAPIVPNQFGMHWDGGSEYNVVGQIGKGAFASVYQVATKSDGQLFAAKELEKRKFMKNGVLDRKLRSEMEIMQAIDHPSIVKYFSDQDAANHLYIIMEFVPCGDVQQYLHQYGPLPEGMAKQMASQVFDALDYLHKKRITHRDIKPDNILIASMAADNFIVKLSDFGLSKVVKDNDTFLKTFCGTLLYCAPEVFPHYDAHVSSKGTKRPRKPPPPHQATKSHSYSQAVDIWSFGAVLWYSLCQKPPFEGVSDTTGRGMFDKIMMTPLDTADLEKQGVSDNAIALLVEMLNTDPACRPSAEACLHHAWLGLQHPPNRVQPDLALGAIAEEMEDDYDIVGGPDVGALSLDERQHGSQYSEISLDSEDLNFFDPRKSKRFKANGMEQVIEDEGDLIDSSPEVFDSIPIMRDDKALETPALKVKPVKLFGEISQSDLQTAAFDKRANDAVGSHTGVVDLREQYHSSPAPEIAQQTSQSGSLQGAEQLVRDMNMDSAYSQGSQNAYDNVLTTPPAGHRVDQAQTSQFEGAGNPEETPRPGQGAPFSRQIQIPLPPSFYYIADDPTTHNIEYASKVSGRDFAADPAYKLKDATLPDTTSSSQASATDYGSADGLSEAYVGVVPTIPAATSRPVFGRLIHTPGSADFDMALHHQITTFGRSRKSTYIWPDESDVRIGKDAVTIFFGTDKLIQSQDIVDLPDLYCNILTHGSNGLVVNGVELSKDTPSKHSYGRIFTGDEVEVCKPTRDKPGLKFIVQINVGASRIRRPRFGPDAKFKVIHDTPGSSQPKSVKKRKDDAADGGAQIDESR